MKVHPVLTRGWLGVLAATLAAGYCAFPAGATGHFALNGVPTDALKTAEYQVPTIQLGNVTSNANSVTRLARIHFPWGDDHDSDWHRRHHQYYDRYDHRWYDFNDYRRRDRDDYRYDNNNYRRRDRDDYRYDNNYRRRDRDDYRYNRDDYRR